MSLQSKTVVITGATSGVGAVAARKFAAAGAKVVAGGRRIELGQKLEKDAGENLTFVQVDVSDFAQLEAFFEKAATVLGKFDYVLHNAGTEGNVAEQQLGNLGVENAQKMFDINTIAPALGFNLAVKHMNKNGVQTITSSAVSAMSLAGAPIYAATKSAVDGLVRSFAAQLRESQDETIRSTKVFSLNIVMFESEMSARFVGNDASKVADFSKASNPSQKTGTGEDFFNGVVKILTGDYISGAQLTIDSGAEIFPLAELFDRYEKLNGTASPFKPLA